MFLLLALVTVSATATQRPNILLIVSEDNGPELGCYGEPFVKTPVLDHAGGDLWVGLLSADASPNDTGAHSGNNRLGVDNVRLQAVPETSSVALLMLGGVFGAVWLRRRGGRTA